MNPKRMYTSRHWKAWVIAALALAGGSIASAQETNHINQTDFSSFRIISQRNIFDPNRTARHRDRGGQSRKVADAFFLVGTMSYDKGNFAFFDGTHSEYRKILQSTGAIGDYQVTDIKPNSVKLEAGGRQVEMKVGTQMERQDEGGWRLVANSELPSASTETPASTTDDKANPSSSGEVNDVLRKLMQQREQEMK